MKIVIDTNVFISAVFFGGLPLKVIQSVISKQNDAYIYHLKYGMSITMSSRE